MILMHIPPNADVTNNWFIRNKPQMTYNLGDEHKSTQPDAKLVKLGM
jgi:hypothetical protein